VRLPRLHPQDREILRLAVPALGALVAEPLFLLADSAIVGHLGTPPLAGLAIAGTVLTTVVYLCVFLAYGTTAAVARQLGAGNLRAALAQGVDGLWLAGAIGLLILAVGTPLAPTVVGAFHPSPAVADHAVTYLRISLLGVPAMLVVLAATGLLRGLSDTRTPLLVAVAGAAANVVLNLALVYGVGLGIAGSALGTVVAQAGMAFASGAVVLRGARRHGAGLRPDLPGIRAAAAASVPLFVRTVSLRIVLVAAAVVATRLGDVPLAAHQVAATLWSFLALALDALAIAGQAIVGRCLGAGDVAATRRATARMIQWGLGAGVLAGIVVTAGRDLYVPLFTTDEAVRQALAAVLVVVGLMQPLAGVVFVLDGVLIGASDARFLAWAGVGSMLAFLVPAWAVLQADGGLTALWWAFTVFMAARALFLVPRARGVAWMVTGAPAR
jgi:putative MATE family efflux protein